MNCVATLWARPPSSEKCSCHRSSRPARFFDDVPDRRSAALLGSIVHDCHPRSNGMHESRSAALPPAMMRHDVNIDLAQSVGWAHQFHFFVAREIAQVQDSQLAKI